ncbi:precorrin-2 dehydrogenase/sirohydrochlorin ferrochelatase family protein [Leptospira ilyithenensis]|uniref:precorrin-2 dehydrogenase n=1 Tax=Leptospira ilyithenensis TaxID=2484901 RepID=A0A4R9LST0_9LEPT|nr:bifunctional precorrin-2 dehydrogenase/sirohydrochlorin ferrochelatase [Leptospira ilyithenensis]TGN11655.1 bifunctional precorrin-2 dehydrogenase/sirohydrochlorin ferrochelatase [Leptospira ilyithenensis]
MTKKYPIFLNLENKNVLLIGGGLACLEKLQGLEGTLARITIITKETNPFVQKWIEEHSDIIPEIREAKEEDLVGRDLIFIATNDSETNKRFRLHANSLGILANAVDDPPNCDFYSSSLVDLGPVQFSISTDGKFAGLTATLRKLFEDIIPKEDGELFERLFLIRKTLKERLPDQNERRGVLKRVIRELEEKYFGKSDL